jgi:hypothetical protein
MVNILFDEMAKVLCVRYGLEDLKVWVQDVNILDTLADLTLM